MSIASVDSRQRKDRYQKIVSTFAAKGFAGELIFCLSNGNPTNSGVAIKDTTPLILGFRLLDLTNSDEEVFAWTNSSASSRLGRLTIHADPASAEVFLNGVSKGRATAGILKLMNLIPGTYSIDARQIGYSSDSAQAKVDQGSETTLNLLLKPLPTTEMIERSGLAFEPGYSYLRIGLDSPYLGGSYFLVLENSPYPAAYSGQSWIKITSGMHKGYLIGSHDNSISYQFEEDLADLHLYDVQISPPKGLLSSALGLSGFKSLPLEPNWLSEGQSFEKLSLNSGTGNAVFYTTLGSAMGSLGLPFLFGGPSQGAVIGTIIGSSSGILALGNKNAEDAVLGASLINMLGPVCGFLIGALFDNKPTKPAVDGYLQLAIGSTIAGALTGVLWGAVYGSKTEEWRADERNIAANQEARTKWEKSKEEVEQFNQGLVEQANRQIAEDNKSKSIIVLRDLETADQSVLKLEYDAYDTPGSRRDSDVATPKGLFLANKWIDLNADNIMSKNELFGLGETSFDLGREELWVFFNPLSRAQGTVVLKSTRGDGVAIGESKFFLKEREIAVAHIGPEGDSSHAEFLDKLRFSGPGRYEIYATFNDSTYSMDIAIK